MGFWGSLGGIFFGRCVEAGFGVFAERGGHDPTGVEGVNQNVGFRLSGMDEFYPSGGRPRECPCHTIAFNFGGKRVGDWSLNLHGVV